MRRERKNTPIITLVYLLKICNNRVSVIWIFRTIAIFIVDLTSPC